MNRREVAKGIAALALGVPLMETLDRWTLLGEDDQLGVDNVDFIGSQDILHIEQAAQIFREWDDQFGGGLRRKAVVGQLNEVSDMLRDSRSIKTRQRLFAAMAMLSETAAIMSWASGRQDLAQQYYIAAFRATRSAEDWAFGANVLAGMARQLLYLEQPADALELVRMAQSYSARSATPAVAAMLHVREAWAYAKLGRINAFHRAVGQAEDAFTRIAAEEEPYWIRYFDAAELEGTVGGRLLELARDEKKYASLAAARIGRAIASRRVGVLRSSALDQLGLAEARLIEGEYGEAATRVQTALQVVVRTPSDRVRVMMFELYANSASYASVPVVARLREQVRDVLASN